MSLTFTALKSSYPTEPRKALFSGMGGHWPTLVDDPNYENTCAIRLSIAFNRAGFRIPSGFREAITGAGDGIILKVKTFADFLHSQIGPANWGMSKLPGVPIGNAMPKYTGLFVYHAKWTDATGHFDLWTGSEFVGSGNLSQIEDGYGLQMWFIS